jgi:uncharacterized membrane protein
MAVRGLLGDEAARVLGGVFVVLVVLGYVFAHLAHPAMPWLATNLTLAAIPPVATALLAAARRRRLLWWCAATTTLVLLPNTPYVLTDIIHFREDRWIAAAWGVWPWVVPTAYAAVVCVGVCGYAYVLARLVADVRRHHGRFVSALAAVVLNAFCAAGVWLGRVARLNSWDVAHPGLLRSAAHHAASLRALAEMGVVFIGAGAAAAVLVLLVSRFGPRVAALVRG